MKTPVLFIAALGSLVMAGSVPAQQGPGGSAESSGVIERNAADMLRDGRHTFRYDTFGDEAWWGDTLRLHQAIEGSALGGVGPGVSPKTALAVGLKVDVDALPPEVLAGIQGGQINLNDPAVTLALLKLNAVVGVTGIFDTQGRLSSMGIQCALCHSSVDNSFAPGIGHRLDGWANRDLNVGAVVALAPNLTPLNCRWMARPFGRTEPLPRYSSHRRSGWPG